MAKGRYEENYGLRGSALVEVVLNGHRGLFALVGSSYSYELIYVPATEERIPKEEEEKMREIAQEYFLSSGYGYYSSYFGNSLSPRSIGANGKNLFLEEALAAFPRITKKCARAYIALEAYGFLFGFQARKTAFENSPVAMAYAPYIWLVDSPIDWVGQLILPRYGKPNFALLAESLTLFSPKAECLFAIAKVGKEFGKYLEGTIPADDGKLTIAVASHCPIFHSPALDELLLRENDGIGILPTVLVPFLLKQGNLASLYRALLSHDLYIAAQMDGYPAFYLPILSAFRQGGMEKEAREVARLLCEAASNVEDYAYLSHFLSKEELERGEAMGRFRPLPKDRYERGKAITCATVSLKGSKAFEYSTGSYAYFGTLGAGLWDLSSLDPFEKENLTGRKKKAREAWRMELDHDKERAGDLYAIGRGLGVAGDVTFLRSLSEGEYSLCRKDPRFHLMKAAIKRSNPRKLPDVKRYGK